MKVVIIGSGASWPDSIRCSPCQVVQVGNEPLMFDCGPGSAMNLMKANFGPISINRVFLTHLHMDHCLEFPSIVFQGYLLDRKTKVDVYGPPGTADYSRLLSEKVYPYAPQIVRKIGKQWEVEAHETSSGLVFQTDKYRVLAAPVDHGIPTNAYRIEAKEGTVVISGDTRPSKSLIGLARGADILIHECSFPEDMAERARQSNHSVPSEVGEVAQEAGVKRVVLTHLFPSWRGREGELMTGVSSKFRGEVIAGHDLLEIVV